MRAELARAHAAGELDETEDSLSVRATRRLLAGPAQHAGRPWVPSGTPVARGRASAGTGGYGDDELAQRAVVARERTFGNTIEGYVTLAAAQQNRVVATVRVARPLSAEQAHRLRAALSGRPDATSPSRRSSSHEVLGGIRVELGDQVIEGTVESRLDEAKRLFG